MQDQIVKSWYTSHMTKRRPSTAEEAQKALLIGSRIRHRREQMGYTQRILAARVNITAGAIGQYETGLNLPKMSTLERLAMELDVTTEWLITGDDPDESATAHTKAELAALRVLRRIPVDLQPAALAMLEGLAQKQTPD